MTSTTDQPGPAGIPRDPLGDVWDDPEWRDEYMAVLSAEHMAEHVPAMPVDADAWASADASVWSRDEAFAAGDAPAADDAPTADGVGPVVVEHELAFELDELGSVVRASRVVVADRYRRIARVLRNAALEPDPWVGPDPTVLPGWVDVRGRTAVVVRRDRVDVAVRAAAADIAARLRMSDTAVRAQASHAEILAERCPRLWDAFLAGDVPDTHVAPAATAAATLPNDPGCWALFDELVTVAAVRMNPPKFRNTVRRIRERVHPETIDTRHSRAAEDRGVWVSGCDDGMATLTAFLPAHRARAVMARLDAIATHLRGQDDETRTLQQLRADAFTDLLTTGRIDEKTGGAVTATVAITVPALTLIGKSDEPATLEGYGPIDLDTAKQLAGSASSWLRILTHPVTGVPLMLDRTRYKVPAALKEWLGVIHPTCTGPGCQRLARDCEIDHLIEWQHGGTTDARNLGPACQPHHRMKTESLWQARHNPDGTITWISPTGYPVDPNPPPF